MDYLKFVEHHRATNADITIGCLPVDYERASDFGLMKVNDDGEIFVRLQCLPCSTYSPFGVTSQANSNGESSARLTAPSMLPALFYVQTRPSFCVWTPADMPAVATVT